MNDFFIWAIEYIDKHYFGIKIVLLILSFLLSLWFLFSFLYKNKKNTP